MFARLNRSAMILQVCMSRHVASRTSAFLVASLYPALITCTNLQAALVAVRASVLAAWMVHISLLCSCCRCFFRDGKIAVLVNCEILTEGFDEPGVDCILMARPTRSQGLYIQVGGGKMT